MGGEVGASTSPVL